MNNKFGALSQYWLLTVITYALMAALSVYIPRNIARPFYWTLGYVFDTSRPLWQRGLLFLLYPTVTWLCAVLLTT